MVALAAGSNASAATHVYDGHGKLISYSAQEKAQRAEATKSWYSQQDKNNKVFAA